MNPISITLLERENGESPNIGTITSLSENILRDKAKMAIESHFDQIVKELKIQDGLNLSDVYNAYPLDVTVVFEDGSTAMVEAQQTWLY